MDNYSLEEVKILINNNMITPEIFDNILKSTTRRIELYNDKDDWEILKLLSTSDIVPIEIKNDINKYLKSYERFTMKENKKMEKNRISRRTTTITILFITVLLIIVCIFLIINRV